MSIGRESHHLVLISIAQWSLCISPPYHLKSWNAHRTVLDTFGSHLITTLLTCAPACFPTHSVSTTRRRLVGWTQSVNRLKESSMFWYKIWEESGCPSSGVLSQIKKNVKRRYKYEVGRLIRRQTSLLQKKLAYTLFLRIKSPHFGLM